MHAGGLAQMSFAPIQGSGLASRRGGPNVKPLSFDGVRTNDHRDTSIPTPRTSRGHMLAGLRTAPKTSTGVNYPGSPVTSAPPSSLSRTVSGSSYASGASDYNGPKTALPRFAAQKQNQQQSQQQQNTQQNYHNLAQMTSQFTTDHVLAPPELQIDESQEQMDPELYSRLVNTNIYLAQQQQRLQQQLLEVQAAAHQFQGLSLNSQMNPQMQHYQQQQQLAVLYGQAQARQVQPQQQIYAYQDPTTGQVQYFMDNSFQQQQQYNEALLLQQQQAQIQLQIQQMQQLQAQAQAQQVQMMPQQQAPRVQVSPPQENAVPAYRTNSNSPKRNESTGDHAPLPPPSANAFRRGHKKVTSLALNNSNSAATKSDVPNSAGPKTSSFPSNVMGTYGPGQARAGEHPVRQPRGPPNLEELKAKPTAKIEGSLNFATRTRRTAVHNLVRAGLSRRKGTSSSTGSMSPVSENAEDADTPITDNESESGRSGSGSLAGDAETRSTARSLASTWGAIGSDRPNSRSKNRKVETTVVEDHSFAGIFKNANRDIESQEQRKTHMLVLTSADKRKANSS